MGIPPEESKSSIGKIVKLEMKNFKESSHAEPLIKKHKGDLDLMLRRFLESIYIYHDETPKDLSPLQFKDVVLETLPRRFTGEEKFLSAVPKVVRAYIEYLEEETDQEGTADLLKVVDEMDKKFTRAVKKVKPENRLVEDEAKGQLRKEEDKVGRNDPCPCGSGKKFKKCCMGKGA